MLTRATVLERGGLSSTLFEAFANEKAAANFELSPMISKRRAERCPRVKLCFESGKCADYVLWYDGSGVGC